MLKNWLIFIGYRYSVYTALVVFFFACITGYISNVPVDTIIKKSIMAGCGFGLVFFVSMKMLIKFIPDNVGVVKDEKDVKGDESGEQTSQDS